MNDSPSKPAKTRPTILQVLPDLRSGGVERGVVEVGKALASHGYESYVASNGGLLQKHLEAGGSKHFRLPLHSKNIWVMYRNIGRLCRLIKKYDIDILHARSRAPAWSAYFAAKKMGITFLTTFHGVYSSPNKFKQRYNAIMTRGDHMIAISEFIKQHAMEEYGIAPGKVTVIHRGVDLTQFSPKFVTERRMLHLAAQYQIPEDKPVIMLPGRITGWKGHELLIEALTKLKTQDFFCILVGDDKHHSAHKKRLKEKIIQAGLAGKVQFLGHVKDMPALYCFANVVISSSVRPEAFGRVAAEAQAMGKVVIATDHGGSKETVVDGKTGWLVKPDSTALAEAIERGLALNNRTLKIMSNRALKHIQDHFTLDQMLEKTLALYDTLYKESQRKPGNAKRAVELS